SEKEANMSDKGTVSPKEKEATEKRGRGRPRKQPQESSGSPTPKRPRGRPKGSKNKTATKKVTFCPVQPAVSEPQTRWPANWSALCAVPVGLPDNGQ
ncbi:hypothetical protein NL108_006353, partial [Boleophthalmus pectinirostris]